MTADSALVMEEAVGGGPGTHVLVIGMGEYDYLIGGAMANPDVADGMHQLPAAVRSARQIAKWFLDEFKNDDRPLASLSIVLSEKDPARFDHPRCNRPSGNLPNGDLDSVAAAIVAWVDRASTVKGNLAVLYFVGHGLHAGSSLLLCRDYGKVQKRRFEGAINLDDLLSALKTMQADEQLVFIDACRTADVVDRTLSQGGRAGRNILTPDPPEERDGTEALQSLHFATSAYTRAWADEGTVSIYSDALIQALSGGGAQPQHGWRVGTGGLQEALTAYVRQAAAETGVEQVPDRRLFADFVICRPKRLVVPVRVTCDPVAAWTGPMRLAAEGPEKTFRHNHDPASLRREWVIHLPKESYTFHMAFDGIGDFEDISFRDTVVPPLLPVHLQLKRRANG